VARLLLRAVQREGLSSTPSRVAPEKASQTFKQGAVLVNNGGYVEQGGVNPRAIVGVAEEAGENGATDGAKTCRYVPALPHVVFEGSIDTSSALGTGAIAQADLLAEYGVTQDPAGIWYVDKAKATAGTSSVGRIVELVDPIGTINGRVRFIVLNSVSVY
jgi:hypothetical protein